MEKFKLLELKKRKKLIRIAIIVLAVTVLLTVAVLLLRNSVTARYGSSDIDDVLSATVSVGSVSTTVSGSGRLADMDVEDLKLSSTVEVTELCVSAGDKIAEGDLLALVELPTVLAAMNELQSQIESLDASLASAADDAVDSSVTAPLAGRVKRVYAAAGDDVAAVMYAQGALARLSLDGYMAVDIDCGNLSVGDAVTVTLADGTEYDGTVDSSLGGSAVVLFTDDGPAEGDEASVYDADGVSLGSGEVYIHQALDVTGYTGTVGSVYARENARVYAGSTLFTLSDTASSGNYNTLLKERSELEEQLQELIVIYKEGAVYAHSSGSISSLGDVDTATDGMITLMSICPDKTMSVSVSVDESDILALSVGQTAAITVESVGDEEYPGTVTEIDTAGTASNGVTYYTVTLTLDKAEKMLSGMSASAAVRIEGVDGALIIPSAALTQTSAASYVYTTCDEVTGELGGMKEVTVGLNNGSYVEISSGLSEGDTVYYKETSQTGGFGGGRFSGGEMPSGMEMPSGGGMSSGGSGNRPDFSGGGMPSGGFPGGGQ